MAEMWDYWLYSMNAPFGRTHVTRGWNRDLVLYDRGWNRDLVLYDHTFSNLSGMERECITPESLRGHLSTPARRLWLDIVHLWLVPAPGRCALVGA